MIQRLIFTMAVLSFSITAGSAQSSRGQGMEGRVVYNQLKNTYRVEGQLLYTYTLGIHRMSMGLITTLYSDHAETNTQAGRLTGGVLEYEYLVPTELKPLTLGFRSGIGYRLYANAFTASVFDAGNDRFEPVITSSLEHFVDLRIGYKITLDLPKGIYISQSIDGGLFRSWLVEGRARGEVAPSDFIYDFRRYGDVGFIWSLGAALGYRF